MFVVLTKNSRLPTSHSRRSRKVSVFLAYHAVYVSDIHVPAAYAIAIRGAEFPDAEIRGMIFEPEAGDNNRGWRGKHDDDDDMEDY